jgi:D-alanine-D-alanine ligase
MERPAGAVAATRSGGRCLERKCGFGSAVRRPSAEHGLSLMSASNVFGALGPAVTKWCRVAHGFCAVWSRGRFPNEVPADGPLLTLLPGGGGGLVVVSNNDAVVEPPAPVDVIFLVWHGPLGEFPKVTISTQWSLFVAAQCASR